MAKRKKQTGKTAGEENQVRKISDAESAGSKVHNPHDPPGARRNEMKTEWAQEKTTKEDGDKVDKDGKPIGGDSGDAPKSGSGGIDPSDPDYGRYGSIGKDEIDEAYATWLKYKDGKTNHESRIVEHEQWWKQRHWDIINGRQGNANPQDPQPTSAWLFNSLANKHADAMDSYPEANVLPREEGDKQDAQLLSEIMPVILERNKFKKVYSDNWWYKLKHGTAVYGVYWNPSIDNGLGDIDVKAVDLLNIFWEPGVKDIQKSRNVFTVELVDNDILETMYPFLEGKTGSAMGEITEYITDDQIDNSEKTAVFDWYYKDNVNGRDVVQYCKFACGEVIYASENDPALSDKGFYEHAKYPFVFDSLFPIEGAPCGFGYIDIMKDPQMYIDKLNSIIAKNALLAGKKRFFVEEGVDINEAEFADWGNDFIHVAGNISDTKIREIEVNPLPGFIVNFMEMKIDELKETSGNRDFSQGTTTSGVTAASAIAALQEAGSKLSRDMIQTTYQAFEDINYLVLELIRQFYDEPRFFRVVGENGMERFEEYDNRNIREQAIDTLVYGADPETVRKPIFDIEISAQKQSPFSKISQNELAKELFGMGLFNPEMADQALVVLDMMQFEGRDEIIHKVQANQQMQMQIQMLAQQVQELQGILGMQQMVAGGVAAEENQPRPQPKAEGNKKKPVETNALGEASRGEAGNVAKARARAASASVPK